MTGFSGIANLLSKIGDSCLYTTKKIGSNLASKTGSVLEKIIFLKLFFDCSVSQDAYEYKKNYGGWHNTLSTDFIFLLRVDFGETSLLSYVQWFGLGSK